jgi:hypothetical protein
VEAVEGMPIVRHTIIQWDNSTSDNRGWSINQLALFQEKSGWLFWT